MTQKTSIVVRATSGLASVVLALTGVSLVATPAAAAPLPTVVTGADILPTETPSTYQQWHEGDASNTVRAYSVKADGLHLGEGNSSQIIKGLPTPTAADTNFAAEVSASSVTVAAGSVTYQIPIFYDGTRFTTLRTTSLGAGTHGLVASGGEWEISRPIVNPADPTQELIPAGLVDFDDLLVTLEDVGFAPIGFGVQAESSATVSTITWNSDAYTFAPNVAGAVASTVVVRQVDLDPTEKSDGSNYSRWHEGNNWPTPASSVHNDGLHLGDGNRSTVIKGSDIPVTKSELASYIERASLSVDSGSVTLQVPVFFSGATTFTTLRSVDLGVGTHTFSLTDTWATTKALPGFLAQGEGSLGDLLDAIYGNRTAVRLGGFGVQANDINPAVIPSIIWDSVKYSFTQPVTTACPATAGPASTNVASNGWTFGESRATGHNVYTSTGLHVYTESNGTTDKAAGYRALDIPLSAVGVPAIDLTVNSGGSPSIQIGIDLTGDGTWDGYLVNEGTIYGAGKWWTNKSTFGVTPGGGYPSLGTLDDYLVANPDARVVSFGYSLGSGVLGDTVIHSITIGCQTYGFTAATPAAPGSAVTVTGNDIRPNESIYAGWHEGTANARRVYSVQTDGLHLGAGNKASQILYGLDVPLATTTLESVITATSLDVVSGSASLQVPLFYGAAQRFTTIRKESLSAGVHTVSVSDVWVTSGAIRDNAGVQIYAAGEKVPLADLLAKISTQGDVKVLGYAVQANSPTLVKSLTGGNVKYTFSPVAAASTTAVRVTDPEIATSESTATYSSWHEGYNDNLDDGVKAYKVTKDGLTLGTGARSQIIKGVPLSAKPLIDNLRNAAVTVTSGSVTYQVPLTFGAASTFTTLRSPSVTGTSAFDLTSQWVSSRSFGTIVKNTDYAFGDILDQLNLQTNVHVLAFGVQAQTPSTVSSISWDGTQYVFTGPITIAAPTVTGTPTVGQTLTATSGAVLPTTAVTTFRWKADGTTIGGATSSTYVLTGSEFEKVITVEATAVLSGYVDASATSAPTHTVGAGVLVMGAPTVTGIAQSHRILTANPGTWGPAPVVLTYQWLKNGTAVSGATNSTLTLGSSDVGATFTVKVTGAKLGYPNMSVVSPVSAVVTPRDVTTQRLAGANRYGTAVEVSKFGFADGEPTIVYLATGAGYADALSAGPAAAHDDAPLLLTAPDSIPAEVAVELVRLAPDEIIVVGGLQAVSAQVFSQLGNLSFHPDMTRLAGSDRFETSRKIADRFDSATTAYIANGNNFPDALSAGPAAAHFDGPVLLVDGAASTVGAPTLALLTELGVTEVKIAGGEAAVSAAIKTQLSGSYTVKRNDGVDRYTTALAINADEFTSTDTVFLATGEGYADALTGSVLAGIQGAPLFISPANCVPAGVRNAITALDASKVIVLGGTSVLTVAVESLAVC